MFLGLLFLSLHKRGQKGRVLNSRTNNGNINCNRALHSFIVILVLFLDNKYN